MLKKICALFSKSTKQPKRPPTDEEKAYANLSRVRLKARLCLMTMESTMNDSLPSCQHVVMEALEEILNNSFEQAKNWDASFDYDERTYMALYNIAHALLVSGRFHIYRGVLNPHDESTHLIGVFRQCLEWFETNGHIDEQEKIEELQILWSEIQQVG